MKIRSHYRNDCPSDIRDGETFKIIGFTMNEVDGDHPEPQFHIQFESGASRDEVPAECIFEGYDEVFDGICKRFPLTE